MTLGGGATRPECFQLRPALLDPLLHALLVALHRTPHPAVAEVAVVGVPDARAATEDVWAVVVPRPGHVAELGALQRYLEEQDVASYKVPRRLMVVDALPRNPLGKVVRASLREQAARMAPRSGTR